MYGASYPAPYSNGTVFNKTDFLRTATEPVGNAQTITDTNLDLTGNLIVQGTTNLQGQVNCDNVLNCSDPNPANAQNAVTIGYANSHFQPGGTASAVVCNSLTAATTATAYELIATGTAPYINIQDTTAGYTIFGTANIASNFNTSSQVGMGVIRSTNPSNVNAGQGLLLSGAGYNSYGIIVDSSNTVNIGNQIINRSVTTGPPLLNAYSSGVREVLYAGHSPGFADYALGIDVATLWYGIPQNNTIFMHKWYGGTTAIATLDGSGAFTASSLSDGTASIHNGTASLSALSVSGTSSLSGLLSCGSISATNTVGCNALVAINVSGSSISDGVATLHNGTISNLSTIALSSATSAVQISNPLNVHNSTGAYALVCSGTTGNSTVELKGGADTGAQLTIGAGGVGAGWSSYIDSKNNYSTFLGPNTLYLQPSGGNVYFGADDILSQYVGFTSATLSNCTMGTLNCGAISVSGNINGVTPTQLSFVDATSSIQTQFNNIVNGTNLFTGIIQNPYLKQWNNNALIPSTQWYGKNGRYLIATTYPSSSGSQGSGLTLRGTIGDWGADIIKFDIVLNVRDALIYTGKLDITSASLSTITALFDFEIWTNGTYNYYYFNCKSATFVEFDFQVLGADYLDYTLLANPTTTASSVSGYTSVQSSIFSQIANVTSGTVTGINGANPANTLTNSNGASATLGVANANNGFNNSALANNTILQGTGGLLLSGNAITSGIYIDTSNNTTIVGNLIGSSIATLKDTRTAAVFINPALDSAYTGTNAYALWSYGNELQINTINPSTYAYYSNLGLWDTTGLSINGNLSVSGTITGTISGSPPSFTVTYFTAAYNASTPVSLPGNSNTNLLTLAAYDHVANSISITNGTGTPPSYFIIPAGTYRIFASITMPVGSELNTATHTCGNFSTATFYTIEDYTQLFMWWAPNTTLTSPSIADESWVTGQSTHDSNSTVNRYASTSFVKTFSVASSFTFYSYIINSTSQEISQFNIKIDPLVVTG